MRHDAMGAASLHEDRHEPLAILSARGVLARLAEAVLGLPVARLPAIIIIIIMIIVDAPAKCIGRPISLVVPRRIAL